jgi:y4mF family transcriptional regulator
MLRYYTLKGILNKFRIILHPNGYKITDINYICTQKGIKMELANFVREKRKSVNLTQPELAEKAGVGLRFVRELEQGKESLRMDKVNQVLRLFGYAVGAVPDKKENES